MAPKAETVQNRRLIAVGSVAVLQPVEPFDNQPATISAEADKQRPARDRNDPISVGDIAGQNSCSDFRVK